MIRCPDFSKNIPTNWLKINPILDSSDGISLIYITLLEGLQYELFFFN